MLSFPCIYCRKKLTTKEKHAGKKGICPACKHTIFIPKSGVSRKTLELPEKKTDTRIDPKYWENKTNAQIAEALLKDQPEPCYDKDEQQIVLMKRMFRFMIPAYDEITLFAFSFAFIFLHLINYVMKEDILNIMFFKRGVGLTIVFLISIIGMVMSLFNIFFERVKHDFEKYLLLFFAIYVSSGTGIYAAIIMFKSLRGWQLIFPAWNVFNAIALFLLYIYRVIDIQCVIDEKPKILYVIVGMVSIIILLCLCNYAFKLHWSISYSICLCYTMSLLRTVQDIFGAALFVHDQST